MEYSIKLSPEEVNFIQSVLGELPTKTGAFPLVVKIKQQCDEQTPPQPPAAP